jgi:hypothetical protein
VTTVPTIAAMQSTRSAVQQSLEADMAARRTTLVGIIRHLEEQRELVSRQYHLAKAWQDDAWNDLSAALATKDKAAHHRALEAVHSAQETLVDAEATGKRLDIRLSRHTFALDQIDGTVMGKPAPRRPCAHQER